MSTNVAAIIGGPAIVSYGGASFYSKEDIKLEPVISPFDITVDAFQRVDQRRADTSVRVRITPVGRWTALSILFPYATLKLGELITPVRTFGAVNLTTNVITITAHGLRAGMAVRLTTSTTLPAGLSAATLYYVGAVDANSISLHLTYAAAIALTGAVDITDAGTGEHKLLMQEPLVIQEINTGDTWTFHNAAVVQMPAISAGVRKTLFGEVVFECFRKNNTATTAANAVWTKTTGAFSYPSFTPADILTQPYSAAWGAAPWDAIVTKEGWEIAFNLGLREIRVDADGTVTRQLTSLEVVARGQPMNVSRNDLMTKLLLQDTGAAMGASLAGADNLIITGTGVYIIVYKPALINGPQSFGSQTDGLQTLEWNAMRKFTGGVPDPLFYVGTAAP